MNMINLMGRVCIAPKLTTAKTGPRCAFRIAVNRMVRSGGADFFDIVAWGNVAKAVAKHIQVGEMVGVSGSARVDFHTGRDGTEYVSFRVDALSVTFSGRGKADEDAADTEVAADGEVAGDE